MIRKLPLDYDGIQVCIARPGVVTSTASSWSRAAVSLVFRATNVITRATPNVSLEELSAAVLDQAIHGFEKETLSNADLVRLGTASLQTRRKVH